MLNTIRKLLALALAVTTLFACAFAENDNVVVATYNGGEVTIKEVENDLTAEINMMSTTMNYYYQLMGNGTYTVTEDDLRSIREYIVEAYAKYEILLAKMQEMGIADLTQEEKDSLRANAEYYYLQYVYSYVQQGLSADEAAYYLDMQGISIDAIYENSYKNAVQTKITNALTVDETVTEEDILAKYESLASEYETTYGNAPLSVESNANSGGTVYFMPENMRYVKHIILFPEDEALSAEYKDAVNLLTSYETEYANLTSAAYQPQYDEIVEKAIKEECLENIEATKQLVNELKSKVLEDVMPKAETILDAIEAGESFDTLIETYTGDPGSSQEPIKTNGYLVYQKSTTWDEAFLDAANSLENVGDISEPSVGYLGVYIVKYESQPETGRADFADVKDAVIASIISERKSEVFKTQSQIWYEEANIQLNIDAFE